MTLSIGVLMDPIERLKPAKDSTLAILEAAARRGHRLEYLAAASLSLRDGEAWAATRRIEFDSSHDSIKSRLDTPRQIALRDLDVVLARKDPPFDSEFHYDTLVLGAAERAGVRVFNRPQALRDANEKLFALEFPQCCPPTRVARDASELRAFVDEQGAVVLKPLDGMAGRSIFRSHADDPNLNVILETLTGDGTRFALAQRYLPEIVDGDKRILMIGGEVVPHALARVPQGRDFRGNLARGGVARAQALSERDRWIAAEVGPELRRRGLLFVGLDVIGDFLTEINVTSPTGIRELDAQCGLDIGALVIEAVEQECARAPAA